MSTNEQVNGKRIAAAILSRMDDGSQERILSRIADQSPDLARSIQDERVTLDYLAALNPQSIHTVLKEVDRRDMIISLSRASESTRTTVLESMSERARAVVVEELQQLGTVADHEIAAARHRVVSKLEYLRDRSAVREDPKGSTVA